MVGTTEKAIKLKGMAYRKRFEQNLAWPTLRCVGMTSAVYKLLAGVEGQLLGKHVLSDNASD
jgi:glutathione reductase (NADPH)